MAAALSSFLPAAATARLDSGETTEPSGRLTQLAGTAGCISAESTFNGRCRLLPLLAQGPLDDPPPPFDLDLAISSDERHLYLTSGVHGMIVLFDRSPATGELTWRRGNCWSQSAAGRCVKSRALGGPTGLAVSPDGRNVYVSSYYSDAVSVFRRDSTSGKLRQLPGKAGCVSRSGSRGQCTKANALGRPSDVAVSRNGRAVYVTSLKDDAVTVLARSQRTGSLTQLRRALGPRIRDPIDVAIGPSGKSVYVVSGAPRGNVAIFAAAASGALKQRASLTTTRAGQDPSAAVISPDGSNFYVAGAGGIGVFKPPTQLPGARGCIGPPASVARWHCQGGGLPTTALAITSDGQHLYGVGRVRNSAVAETGVVVAYRREAGGALTRVAGAGSCAGFPNPPTAVEYADCEVIPGVRSVWSVLASPDGKNVYVVFRSDFAPGIAVFRRD